MAWRGREMPVGESARTLCSSVIFHLFRQIYSRHGSLATWNLACSLFDLSSATLLVRCSYTLPNFKFKVSAKLQHQQFIFQRQATPTDPLRYQQAFHTSFNKIVIQHTIRRCLCQKHQSPGRNDIFTDRNWQQEIMAHKKVNYVRTVGVGCLFRVDLWETSSRPLVLCFTADKSCCLRESHDLFRMSRSPSAKPKASEWPKEEHAAAAAVDSNRKPTVQCDLQQKSLFTCASRIFRFPFQPWFSAWWPGAFWQFWSTCSQSFVQTSFQTLTIENIFNSSSQFICSCVLREKQVCEIKSTFACTSRRICLVHVRHPIHTRAKVTSFTDALQTQTIQVHFSSQYRVAQDQHWPTTTWSRPLRSTRARVRFYRTWRSSENLEGFLELDDQLPVALAHVVAEVVLHGVDRLAAYLKRVRTASVNILANADVCGLHLLDTNSTGFAALSWKHWNPFAMRVPSIPSEEDACVSKFLNFQLKYFELCTDTSKLTTFGQDKTESRVTWNILLFVNQAALCELDTRTLWIERPLRDFMALLFCEQFLDLLCVLWFEVCESNALKWCRSAHLACWWMQIISLENRSFKQKTFSKVI